MIKLTTVNVQLKTLTNIFIILNCMLINDLNIPHVKSYYNINSINELVHLFIVCISNLYNKIINKLIFIRYDKINVNFR